MASPPRLSQLLKHPQDESFLLSWQCPDSIHFHPFCPRKCGTNRAKRVPSWSPRDRCWDGGRMGHNMSRNPRNHGKSHNFHTNPWRKRPWFDSNVWCNPICYIFRTMVQKLITRDRWPFQVYPRGVPQSWGMPKMVGIHCMENATKIWMMFLGVAPLTKRKSPYIFVQVTWDDDIPKIWKHIEHVPNISKAPTRLNQGLFEMIGGSESKMGLRKTGIFNPPDSEWKCWKLMINHGSWEHMFFLFRYLNTGSQLWYPRFHMPDMYRIAVLLKCQSGLVSK